MKVKNYIATLLLIVIGYGCFAQTSDFVVRGINIEQLNLNTNRFIVYNNNQSDTINLTNKRGHRFTAPVIENTKKYFYLLEYWKNELNKSYSHQIVKLDFNGVIQDTVYVGAVNQDIDSYMLSPNDSLIVVRSFNYQDWVKDNENNMKWNPSQKRDTTQYSLEYKVFRLMDNAVVGHFTIMSSFGMPYFNENSWDPSSSKIIVSRNVLDSTGNRYIKQYFIYNTKSKVSSLIENWDNAIWSPIDSSLIVYVTGKKIWSFNIESKANTMIYHLSNHERFRDLRWTPDGRYLYFNYWKDRFCNQVFGDIVCYPWNVYSQVIDINGIEVYKRMNGHVSVSTWKY